ncbi:MAG: NAD-dependent epimerase/dehydratase family protein [Candidatus Firestonebacteria bacterium]
MRFEGKTAFVTGSNGFVGSFLIERLLQEGAKVKCLVRKTSNLRWLRDLNVELVYGDVTHVKSFQANLKDVDFIFHIAALKHSAKESDYKKNNVIATGSLLKAAKSEALNLKKFIFLSSMAAMGCSKKEKPLCETDDCTPLTHYGVSKAEAEKIVFEYQKYFPVTIIRPPAVYGPRDEDILAMFKAVKAGVRPVFGIQKRYISMVYILDLVEALLLSALSEKANGKIYIIAEDKYYTWKEIQDAVAKALDVKAITIKIPRTILFSAAVIAELFSGITGKNVLLTTHKVRELTGDWVCNIGRAKEDLCFKPEYDIKRGMQLTAKWYMENKWL